MVDIVRGNPLDYKVGPKHLGKGFDPKCLPFSFVTHTAHVRQAINIVSEQKIRADLVYDSSNLNKERIRVVWMSPNSWASGSRYGSVSLSFAWGPLYEKMRAFWVEVANYKIPAVRILLTTKEYSGHTVLTPYDPTDGNGPWWFDSDSNSHFYNNNYCLEFMVEDDVLIQEASDFDVVDHHQIWCNANRLNPNSCSDLAMPRDTAAARFIAGLITTGTPTEPFRRMLGTEGKRELVSAYQKIREWLGIFVEKGDIKFSGTVNLDDVLAQPLGRAIMGAVFRRDIEDIKKYASLFASISDAVEIVARTIEETFQITGIPRDNEAIWKWNGILGEMNTP